MNDKLRDRHRVAEKMVQGISPYCNKRDIVIIDLLLLILSTVLEIADYTFQSNKAGGKRK